MISIAEARAGAIINRSVEKEEQLKAQAAYYTSENKKIDEVAKRVKAIEAETQKATAEITKEIELNNSEISNLEAAAESLLSKDDFASFEGIKQSLIHAMEKGEILQNKNKTACKSILPEKEYMELISALISAYESDGKKRENELKKHFAAILEISVASALDRIKINRILHTLTHELYFSEREHNIKSSLDVQNPNVIFNEKSTGYEPLLAVKKTSAELIGNKIAQMPIVKTLLTDNN